jgi:PKD domain-containing protein
VEGTILPLVPTLVVDSFAWTFGDQSAVMDDALAADYFYAQPGTYQVCLSVFAHDTSAWDSCSAEVCRSLTPAVLGMDEAEGSPPLEAWPVPTGDLLHVRIPDGLRGMRSISLFDAYGRAVHPPFTTNGDRITLSMTSMSPGIYVLVIGTGSASRRAVVLKQ